MTFAVSLVAILLSQQGTNPTAAAPQSGFMVEGKQVELAFPGPKGSVDSAVATWKGLGYLGGAPGKLSDRYTTGYDWAPIQNPPAYKPSAVIWRMRVAILASTQSTRKGAFGFERSVRYSFDDARIEEAKQSLGRLIAWVATFTDGQVRLVPEVTIEREILSGVTISPDFARQYFDARINGGDYEAEDKVFRGPYQSALYIVPGPVPGANFDSVMVHGTPVVGVPENPAGLPYAPGLFDHLMRIAWKQSVRARLEADGYAPATNDKDLPKNGAWALAADTLGVPTDALLDRLKNKTSVPLGLDRLDLSLVRTAQTSYTEITIGSDSDRGDVLHYVEKDANRNGGFLLPVRSDGKPLANLSQTPTLSFWVNSKSTDPLGITLIGPAGKEVHVSIGRSDIAGLCNPTEPAVAFTPDGTWKQISVDAKSLAGAAGFEEVTGLAIEPTPGAMLNGRVGIGDIAADFSDFKFTSESPQALLADPKPDAASSNPEDRAAFAAQAKESSAALIALLVDPSPLVRLNAAKAYTHLKDNEAQPNLVKCVVDIDPWIGSTGLRALMYQGGEIAMLTVRRSVQIGATPLVRATAGELLGATKDPQYRKEISILMVDRSWQNRLAAVRALSQLPGPEAAIVRMAFLDQVEPEIKLAATRSVDPKDEYQERKLLWSAVNEPSDIIRAESDIKLIQSANETFRAEGYKGVRDDSRTTRLRLLAYMAQNPSENHRNAYRLAVTDRSPEVRRTALLGFSTLEQAPTLEEIANVLEDPDPRVQLALQELARKRRLTLPAKTRDLMSQSPDEKIRQGVKDLP